MDVLTSMDVLTGTAMDVLTVKHREGIPFTGDAPTDPMFKLLHDGFMAAHGLLCACDEPWHSILLGGIRSIAKGMLQPDEEEIEMYLQLVEEGSPVLAPLFEDFSKMVTESTQVLEGERRRNMGWGFLRAFGHCYGLLAAWESGTPIGEFESCMRDAAYDVAGDVRSLQQV